MVTVVCMDVQRLHNYLLKGSETVKSAAHIRNIYSSPWDDKMHNKSVGVSITTQLFVLHSLVSKQVFADQSVSSVQTTGDCGNLQAEQTITTWSFCVAPSLQLISLRNSQHPLLSEEYTFFPSDLSFLGLLGLSIRLCDWGLNEIPITVFLLI